MAEKVHTEFVSRHGTRGSAKATFNELGGTSAGINWSTFRDYLSKDGLTPHGRAMLEQGRDEQNKFAAYRASNPGSAAEE